MFGWKRRGKQDGKTVAVSGAGAEAAPPAPDIAAEEPEAEPWRYRGGPLTFRRIGGRTLELFPVDGSVLLGNSTAAEPFLIHTLRILPELDLAGEAGVSRRHAQVVVREAECRLLDLNSAGGTFVNGERVPPGAERVLAPGDEIRLGDEVRFYFLSTTLERDMSGEDRFLSQLIDDALHLEPGAEAAPLEGPLAPLTAVWEEAPVFAPEPVSGRR